MVHKILPTFSYMSVFVVFTPMYSGTVFDAKRGEKLIKLMDLEYGEQLTSIENASDNVRIRQLRFNSSKHRPSTKCTTNRPIELDTAFVLSSSSQENENNDERNKMKSSVENKQEGNYNEITVNNPEVLEEKYPPPYAVTPKVKKIYEPPVTGNEPEHYVDDS